MISPSIQHFLISPSIQHFLIFLFSYFLILLILFCILKPVFEDGPSKFTLLWLHEADRVYGDRLVSLEHVSKYNQVALGAVKRRFASEAGVISNYYVEDSSDSLIFCHFAKTLSDDKYDLVTNMDVLRLTLNKTLEEYNEDNAVMNLVLFDDAIKHCCRISRIIKNDGGHALLVGVGGSGKQSLSRLSSFICGFSVYQITINQTYSMTDLKEDLQKMYTRAGMSLFSFFSFLLHPTIHQRLILAAFDCDRFVFSTVIVIVIVIDLFLINFSSIFHQFFTSRCEKRGYFLFVYRQSSQGRKIFSVLE